MKKSLKFFSEIKEYYYELSDVIREVISVIVGFVVAAIMAVSMMFTIFDPLVVFFDDGRTGEPIDSAIAAFAVIVMIASIIGLLVMGFIYHDPIDFTIFEDERAKAESRKHRAYLKKQSQLQKEYQRSCDYLDQLEMEADMREYAYGKMSNAEKKKMYRLLKINMQKWYKSLNIDM